MNAKTILVIDDEDHILELIRYNLQQNGYEVYVTNSGQQGLEILNTKHVDLVLLDLMLTYIDGLDILKSMKANINLQNIPVIILTAKSDEISKVIGLELGADDYLTKPFGIHELIARIKAVLRRVDKYSDNLEQLKKDRIAEEQLEEIIEVENIVINKTTRIILIDGKEQEMSLKEFDLLYFLAKNRGIVFSRDTLLEKIWGYDYVGETRTVDVHIRNLRKKIEEDDTNPTYIKTVRGVGYKFK